jgi:ATP-dependent RNA helicase RhlE
MTNEQQTFADLGLHEAIMKLLTAREITTPTPIQAQSIPVILRGEDVLGIAQTGTGKTLAFLLPVLQRLLEQDVKDRKKFEQVLIMVPTRELASQVQETMQWFQREFHVFSTVIVGGESIGKQIKEIRRGQQILVATPGRMIDHLQQGTIQLKNTHTVILDEADRMFDMGFAPQIKRVFEYLPKATARQTLLFSATMQESVTRLIREQMKEPVRIEVSIQGSTNADVSQEIVVLDNAHRQGALLELLRGTEDAVLLFSRTKHQAKKLKQFLKDKGFKAEELHGNLSQAQRKRAIEAVQKKKSRILVATDVAGRGIDIPHIGLVINYELPDNPEDYVHRIGRTGRAGKSGRAVSFVLTDQQDLLQQVQRLINEQIAQTHLETVPTGQLLPAGSSRGRRTYGGGNRGGSRGGSRGSSASSSGGGGGYSRGGDFRSGPSKSRNFPASGSSFNKGRRSSGGAAGGRSGKRSYGAGSGGGRTNNHSRSRSAQSPSRTAA